MSGLPSSQPDDQRGLPRALTHQDVEFQSTNTDKRQKNSRRFYAGMYFYRAA